MGLYLGWHEPQNAILKDQKNMWVKLKTICFEVNYGETSLGFDC